MSDADNTKDTINPWRIVSWERWLLASVLPYTENRLAGLRKSRDRDSNVASACNLAPFILLEIDVVQSISMYDGANEIIVAMRIYSYSGVMEHAIIQLRRYIETRTTANYHDGRDGLHGGKGGQQGITSVM